MKQYAKFSQFARTWHHISALEIFRQVFPRKNFSQKKCGAKLATVTSQPVARPPPTSSGKKNSLQPVESIDGYRTD